MDEEAQVIMKLVNTFIAKEALVGCVGMRYI